MGCGASTDKPPNVKLLVGEARSAKSTGRGKLMPLTPDKHKILMATFKAMDADNNGAIDMQEFKTRAKTLGSDESQVEELFHFLDDRGAVHRKHRSDNMLSVDEWISGVREMVVTRGLTDEQFEEEMNKIMATCKAIDGTAS